MCDKGDQWGCVLRSLKPNTTARPSGASLRTDAILLNTAPHHQDHTEDCNNISNIDTHIQRFKKGNKINSARKSHGQCRRPMRYSNTLNECYSKS